MDSRARTNPFPGVRPFRQDEADLFFGRDRQSDELVRRLASNRFLAVVGTSGSGKSSLVQAGLLPSLDGGLMAGAGAHWRMAILRPQDDPIGFLARAIVETGALTHLDLDPKAAEGVVETTLRRSSLGLVEAARLARLAPHENLLVVVDQFEELFRFADLARQRHSGDDAPAFVKLLLEAARQTEIPVYVVITMRSDFLGDCARFRGLPEAISVSQYLIPRLTRDELQTVISGPIGVRGGRIAPSLVQGLLNDIGDDMDQLPVLQHALMRAWDHWQRHDPESRPIDLSDMAAIGGMAAALSRHAEEAYSSLATDRDRTIAERLFKCLTEKGADNRESRRPTPLSRVAAIANVSAADVIPVIDVFRAPGRSFLMPPDDVVLDQEAVIDISHESLIRQWQRLRGWTQAEAESSAMLVRLIEAAQLNQANEGSLWRGHELQIALEWQRHVQPTVAWVGLCTKGDGILTWQSANRFLRDSAAEHRRARLRGKLVSSLGVLILAVVAVLVFATVRSVQLHTQASSRELANRALQQIDQAPARSAHLALAAIDQDPGNALGEYALRQSLSMLEVAHADGILVLDAPVVDAGYTRDGDLLVTASGKTVTIFDAKTFRKVQQVDSNASVHRVWLIDRNTLITQTDDGRAQILAIDRSAATPLSCEGDAALVTAMSVSPSEQSVAVGCSDGAVRVWDAAHPAPQPTYAFSAPPKRAVAVTALTFSADGAYLASGDVNGTVEVWKLGFPTAWIGDGAPGTVESPIKHPKAIRDIGFHRDDPGLLVTAADDNQAIVWRLDMDRRALMKDQEPNRFALPHDHPVIAAQFTAAHDGTYPVITVSGKNAQLWVRPTADAKQVHAHDDWINDANVSSDGELLVTASQDGTARIWSTRAGTPIAVLRGHRAPVNRAVFSPRGDQLVTASQDQTVRVWRVRPPRLLASLDGWVTGAAFAPGGSQVVVGGEHKGYLLALKDFAGNAPPARRELSTSNADQLGFFSWSRDRKFVVGVRATTDVFQELNPVLFDAGSGLDVTPQWLKKWRTATFSSGTDELLTVGTDGRIAVWNLKSLTEADPQPTLTFEEEPLRWMAAMSPDGKWIAAISGENVDLWKRDGSHQLLGSHKGVVMAMQFSRDSRWLLTAGLDGTAWLWPIDRPDAPKELRAAQTGGLYAAAFDASGQRAVTGSADGTISVWNTETAAQVASLRWHSEVVNAVEFSPDGKWILSASDDGTVTLGQCEACMLGVEDLRKRVADLARLPAAELTEIDQQANASRRFLTMPAFLSWLR